MDCTLYVANSHICKNRFSHDVAHILIHFNQCTMFHITMIEAIHSCVNVFILTSVYDNLLILSSFFWGYGSHFPITIIRKHANVTVSAKFVVKCEYKNWATNDILYPKFEKAFQVCRQF